MPFQEAVAVFSLDNAAANGYCSTTPPSPPPLLIEREEVRRDRDKVETEEGETRGPTCGRAPGSTDIKRSGGVMDCRRPPPRTRATSSDGSDATQGLGG
jgi:hypothetical protein